MPHAADDRSDIGRIALWAPVVLYAAAIFLASSIEHPGALPGGTPDYMAHALLYAGFAAVILRAFAAARWRGVTGSRAIAATLAAAAYGFTDEMHQWFVPGRFFQLSDLLADLGGAALGAGGVVIAARAIQSRRTEGRRASR